MSKIQMVAIATKKATKELIKNFSEQYPDARLLLVTNEDGSSMAEKYNKAIDEATHLYSDGWLLFQHDDSRSLMSQKRLEESLDNVSDRADIVGVAGSIKVPPVSPGFWWYGLGTPEFAGSGRVEHIKGDNSGMKFTNIYGEYPRQAAALDGLWLAIKIKTLKNKKNLRFDEKTFTGYHYYDADFCATARALKIPMFTCDAAISHDSGGESMRQSSFSVEQQKFIKKWFRKQKSYNTFQEVTDEVVKS